MQAFSSLHFPLTFFVVCTIDKQTTEAWRARVSSYCFHLIVTSHRNNIVFLLSGMVSQWNPASLNLRPLLSLWKGCCALLFYKASRCLSWRCLWACDRGRDCDIDYRFWGSIDVTDWREGESTSWFTSSHGQKSDQGWKQTKIVACITFQKRLKKELSSWFALKLVFFCDLGMREGYSLQVSFRW